MQKKVVWSIVILATFVVGWYLISPVFIDVEVYEESPIIDDNMDTMSEEELAEFDQAVEDVQDENSERE